MDYERENAKEWQFNPASGPNPGTADADVSDDDLAKLNGPLIQWNTNEIQDDGESSWQTVSYKKALSKPAPKPNSKPLGNPPFGLKAPAAVRNPPAKLPVKPPPKHPVKFSATHPATPSPSTFQPTIQPRIQPILQLTVPPTAPNRPKVNPPPQKRRVFTFAHKNDNPARAAFRAKQAATGKFVLTKPCYAIEPDRFKMYDVLEEMGVRFGSFVRPPQSTGDRDLLLWGNNEQIKATIHELQMWVLQSTFSSHTTKGDQSFAKTGLLSQEKAKILDKAMKVEAIKREYQKAPDRSLTFKFTGYFLWPVDEIRPEDLLGPSYEAFDKLRIAFDSFIVFDRQLSLFKVLTNEDNVVQQVMNRIEGTMKEFVARNRRETVVHMVERPNPQRMRSKVILTEGPALVQGQTKSKVPSLSGKPLAPAQLIEWKKEVELAEEQQFAHWRHLVGKMIKRLHLYRGPIQMRVLLGKFALTTFRRSLEGANGISFEEFLKVMDHPGTKGRMIKDLQEKESPEVLLNYIYNATKIFTPVDAMSTKLDDISPMYTARFEFEIPGTGKVKLEMESSKPSGKERLYEITRLLWTRKTENAEAMHPMEIFMIRLHGGISWELQVSISQSLDRTRITPMMTAFVDCVKFKVPRKNEKGKKHQIWESPLKVFTWTSGMPVSRFEQKTSLRYRIVDNSDWMFEFSRYDDYGTPAFPRAPSTSWGATFWNSEWDRTLGRNARLDIGDPGKWDPQLDKFFPANPCTSGGSREAAGFRQFLAKTKAIAEILDGTPGGGV